MAQRHATLRDVALRAGVSVATASRAMNGKHVVNAGTRQRILAVIDELGFTPSPAAQRLSLGRTQTIGVVVMFLTRPQTTERLRGVAAVLADSEFDLVIYNVESLQKRDHYLQTLVQPKRVDGLLVMSLPPPDGIGNLGPSPIPIVFVDVHTPSVATAPRVIGDDVMGGARAGRHLLDLGHRSIGFVGDVAEDPYGFTSSRDRHAGFRAALDGAGLTIPPAWIGLGAHGRYEARDIAHRMLTGEHRPTAIFAASDTQAFGVLAAARDAGLRVPEDLSVIGYDDVEAADYVGLTTVRQHLFESGRRGAELLLAEIREPSAKPPAVELTPEVVARATTAPPKEGRG